MIALNTTTMKLAIGIACALALALLVQDRNRWSSAAALRQQELVAERSAHSATIANYRAAAAQAREADAANAARVAHAQAAINERTADDYESRIAAARATAERLRRETAAAAAGHGGGGAAPLPRLPAPARSAPQTAGEDGLPYTEQQGEVAALGADDAVIATEQAIQLDELIEWVKAQAAVPRQ